MVGSSRLISYKTSVSLFESAKFSDSIEQKNTGGGNFIPQREISSKSYSSINVSPDLRPLTPTIAPMSPAFISSTATISSAYNLKSDTIHSTLLVTVLLILLQFLTDPE